MTTTETTTSLSTTAPVTHSRPGRISVRHRRILLWALVAAVVLGLSVPAGLAVLDSRERSATGEPAIGGAAPADESGAMVGSGAITDAQSGARLAGPATRAQAPPVDVALEGARLTRSAWLGMRVDDLVAASQRARAVAASAGGHVDSEQVRTGGQPGSSTEPSQASGAAPIGVEEARLVLSVPVAKLDGVVTELARLGTVSYQTSQTEDVTDQYVDAESRVATMKAGVDRLRALLDQATNLDQIVRLESELTARQADLEAIQSRLASLERRTTMSDVTVSLWTGATPLAPGDDDGFLGALRGAWDTLLSSLGVIVTGLAAIVPWLLVVGLLALLVRSGLRRRGRGTPAPAAD